MRQHNTLLGKATPYTKQFTQPKKVNAMGNLGNGLSYAQYQGILNSVDELKDKADVQRMDYEEYVDYNEKATIRSDYNIADITELAKSLERLIGELQQKMKKQDKWNKYLKQLILNAGDTTNISVLMDDKVSMLEQKIKDLEDQLNSLDLNSLVVEFTQNNESSSKYIQNLLRVLQQLPGIVTDIEAICNKDGGGFTIKYKTVNLQDIDLDADLPEPEPDPNEPEDPGPEIPYPEDPDNEETGDYDEELLGKPKDPKGTDAVKSKQTEIELASPKDMSFDSLYANSTSFTDINNALTATKSAITSVEATASPLGIVFAGKVTVTSTSGSVTVNGLFANGGTATAHVNDSDKCTIQLSLSFNEAVTIYSVLTTITATAHNSTSGRSAGGLASIYAKVSITSASTDQIIRFSQYSQGNSDNDSWKWYIWTADDGITSFYVTVIGVASSSSSGGGSSSNDITIPSTGTLSTSCSTIKTEKDVTPEPKPEPEEEQ